MGDQRAAHVAEENDWMGENCDDVSEGSAPGRTNGVSDVGQARDVEIRVEKIV